MLQTTCLASLPKMPGMISSGAMAEPGWSCQSCETQARLGCTYLESLLQFILECQAFRIELRGAPVLDLMCLTADQVLLGPVQAEELTKAGVGVERRSDILGSPLRLDRLNELGELLNLGLCFNATGAVSACTSVSACPPGERRGAHIMRKRKLLYARDRFSSKAPEDIISFTRASIWSYTFLRQSRVRVQVSGYIRVEPYK